MMARVSVSYDAGYCYLKWFRTLRSYGVNVSDDDVVKHLGFCPMVRRVLGFIYGIATVDYPLNACVYVYPGMLHVVDDSFASLSVLMQAYAFTSVRVGMDEVAMRSQKLKALSEYARFGGVSLEAVMADASRAIIRQEVRDNVSLVKDLVVANASMAGVKKFYVNYKLDLCQLGLLQQMFPELNVVLSSHVRSHPHAIAACMRVCAEELILRLIGYSPGWRPGRGYDVVVVDVGANYTRHLGAGRFNIHSCAPIIDVRDSARETVRVNKCVGMMNKKRISAQMYNQVCVRKDCNVRCARRSQDCHIAAPYGMFVHSTYDIEWDDLCDVFDAHRFEIAWVVVHYDVRVFCMREFVVDELGMYVCVEDGRIRFMFGGDSSLGYEHGYSTYMRLLYENLMVTRNGRVYLIERVYDKCGTLFIKFTWCCEEPMVKDVSLHFAYWRNDSDKLMVNVWKYSDDYFLDSLIRKKGDPLVRFRRRVFEVDKRLYELVLGHCVRSGDKSFNLNDIFSAALSFNSRMSINGVDIRAREKLTMVDLLDLVVVCYCEAYRMRFCAGKTIEAYASQEKNKRARSRMGLSDVVEYMWDRMNAGCFNSIFNLYNNFIKAASASKVKKDFDCGLLDTCRRYEISEYVTLCGRFRNYECETMLSAMCNPCVTEIDENAYSHKEGETIVQVLRERMSQPTVTLPNRSESGSSGSYSVSRTSGITKSVSSAQSVRRTKNLFHRYVNSLPESGDITCKYRNEVKKMRNEECPCSDVVTLKKMKGDGNCLFYAMMDSICMIHGVNVEVFRRFLYVMSVDAEKENVRVLLEFEQMGNSDCLMLFSRLFGVVPCVHGEMNGDNFITRLYSAVRDGIVLHYRWFVSGNGGHVDRLVSDKDVDLSDRMLALMSEVDEAVRKFNVSHITLMRLIRRDRWCVRDDATRDVFQQWGIVLVSEDDADVVLYDECDESVVYDGDIVHVFRCNAFWDVTVAFLNKFQSVVIIPDFSNGNGGTRCFVVCTGCGEGALDMRGAVRAWFVSWVGMYEENEIKDDDCKAIVAVLNGPVGYEDIEMQTLCSESDDASSSALYRTSRRSWFHDASLLEVCRGFWKSMKGRSAGYERVTEDDEVDFPVRGSKVTTLDNIMCSNGKGLVMEDVSRFDTCMNKKSFLRVPGVSSDTLQKVDDMCVLSDRPNIGEDRKILSKCEVKRKFFGKVSRVSMRTDGVLNDRGVAVKLCVSDVNVVDSKLGELSVKATGNSTYVQDVKVGNDCVEVWDLRLQPLVLLKGCDAAVQCDLDGEMATSSEVTSISDEVVSAGAGNDSCVDEGDTGEGLSSLCSGSVSTLCVSDVSVGVDDYSAFGLDESNASCADMISVLREHVSGKRPGVKLYNKILASSRLVLHFVHDFVGKGYSGFAGDVMRDCGVDEFIRISDMRKKRPADMLYGMIYITKGNKYKLALNVVSNKRKFMRDCVKVFSLLGRDFAGLRLDTIAVGTGLWGHTADQLVECLRAAGGLRLSVYVGDKAVYKSVYDSMKGSLVSLSLSDKLSRMFDSSIPEVGVVSVNDVISGLKFYSESFNDIVCLVNVHFAYGNVGDVLVGFKNGNRISEGMRECKVDYREAHALAGLPCVDDGVVDVRVVECKGKYGLIVDVTGVNVLTVLKLVLSEFINLFESGKVVRVSLDVVDVSPLEFIEMFRVLPKCRYVVHGYRSSIYNCLRGFVYSDSKHEEKMKMVEPRAFPKLTNQELGFGDPDYIKNDGTVLTYYRNSMIEYLYILGLGDLIRARDLDNYWLSVSGGGVPCVNSDEWVDKGFNIYDNESRCYLFESASTDYMYGYVGEFVRFDDKSEQFITDKKYVLVHKSTRVMLNNSMKRTLCRIDILNAKMPVIKWVNGVPGCGKTSYIVKAHKSGVDLVLTSTLEGIRDIRKRAGNDDDRKAYRTVASVLVNGVKAGVYERVFVDEALMCHAGAIAFIATMTDCNEMVLIGDRHQIPYVDREHVCELLYKDVERCCCLGEELRVSYRCPIDVVVMLSDVYERICSVSDVAKSVRVEKYSGNVVPKVKDTLYLVFFQSEKERLLREGYECKDDNRRVMTVHEAQGLTWKNVICVRMSVKELELYGRREYLTVVVSRHTRSFVYYTDCVDMLSRMINAVKDMSDSILKEMNNVASIACGKVGYEVLETVGESEIYDTRELVCSSRDVVCGLDVDVHMPLRPVDIGFKESFVRLKNVCRYDSEIEYLQSFYDDKMKSVSAIDVGYDQDIVEYDDINICVDRIDVVVSKGVYVPRKYDKLRPRLRTLMPAYRLPSQRQSILGAAKRNLNAPKLKGELCESQLGVFLFENFRRSVIAEDCVSLFDGYVDDRIRVNESLIAEWLSKQKDSVASQCASEVPLCYRAFNCFEFMVKPVIKPPLTADAVDTFPSVQTILYNTKDVNVIFCPIFNVMRDRLMNVLKKKIFIYTGDSVENMEDEINRRVNGMFLRLFDVVENDMSKYDKSQEEALLVFECLLYTALGMDGELVQIWYESRKASIVRDRRNGIRFETRFQKKSGDASTFPGNTWVLLAVLVACYDIDDIEFLMIAGDDSAAWMRRTVVDITGKLADLFNLESKVLNRYTVPYFCSKFIVYDEGRVRLIPDVVKVVCKLGRRDMMNEQHVEEYRVSCVDNWSVLFNERVMHMLSVGVCERYGGEIYDVTKVVRVLKFLVMNVSAFHSLYVKEDGMLLNYNNRSSL